MDGGVLNTLLVSDTGSLGGYVINYVLEEEGGDMDELVEDAMKVVELEM